MQARLHWLRRLLMEPLARRYPVDSSDCTAAHRQVLRAKPLARRVFERFYRQCRALDEAFFGRATGVRWEIGSGAGFMSELYPDVITSEVKPVPFVALIASGDRLPVADGALRAVYAINVFHHLADPRAFLRELCRVLSVGGGVVLIEPHHGWLARRLFKRLHASESFDMSADDWESSREAGPMSLANQALSYVVFRRDRAVFAAEFPELEIVADRPHTHLLYLLSGGVNYRALAPAWSGAAIEWLERLLSPLAGVLALQHSIVIRRRAPQPLPRPAPATEGPAAA
jgi:SAM-dependent methyltransferase